ncbi:MAG: CopG family antitoxin [Chloroflexi bacterium]|nr:CopG family antitoxin [Chloroflexota bacterium]
MSAAKSSISQAKSYQEMGKFWDTHDLTQFWDQTAPAEFEVDIQSEVTYYPVDVTLSTRLADVARRRGISAETLLNLWVQERLVTATA